MARVQIQFKFSLNSLSNVFCAPCKGSWESTGRSIEDLDGWAGSRAKHSHVQVAFSSFLPPWKMQRCGWKQVAYLLCAEIGFAKQKQLVRHPINYYLELFPLCICATHGCSSILSSPGSSLMCRNFCSFCWLVLVLSRKITLCKTQIKEFFM